jgi:hypothetical protein
MSRTAWPLLSRSPTTLELPGFKAAAGRGGGGRRGPRRRSAPRGRRRRWRRGRRGVEGEAVDAVRGGLSGGSRVRRRPSSSVRPAPTGPQPHRHVAALEADRDARRGRPRAVSRTWVVMHHGPPRSFSRRRRVMRCCSAAVRSSASRVVGQAARAGRASPRRCARGAHDVDEPEARLVRALAAASSARARRRRRDAGLLLRRPVAAVAPVSCAALRSPMRGCAAKASSQSASARSTRSRRPAQQRGSSSKGRRRPSLGPARRAAAGSSDASAASGRAC